MSEPHSNHHEIIRDRRFRTIHSLVVEFGPLTQLIIPIDNEGKASIKNKEFTHDKEREIDLRVGDVIKFSKGEGVEFKEISKISAYRESYGDDRPTDPIGFVIENR